MTELKSEAAPRISVEDIIELCELSGPAFCKTPVKRARTGKPKILAVDIRSLEEYPLSLQQAFSYTHFLYFRIFWVFDIFIFNSYESPLKITKLANVASSVHIKYGLMRVAV